MRPIATDTNDFPKLRERGCIYVDKTEFVHRMVSDANTRLFFISRPRRFGKSLTLSVLKALFSGRRELFEGLYIDTTDWKWEKYPVIHFEFNDVDASSVEDFEKSFAEHVQKRLEDAGYAYDESKTVAFNFGNAIESLSVALTLFKKERGFKATWATTGRPSMLMNYLKREDMLRIDPERMRGVSQAEFDVAELRNLKPVAMLYQSGCLTIRDYNPVTESYTLGVPDEEVRRDLCTLMTGVAARTDMQWAASLGQKLLIEAWDDFFDGLKSLYAAMAYGSTEGRVHENSYSYGRCLSFLLASCGFDFTMENVQANGRADVVAKHPAEVCIFELKVDAPVDKAFAQIREKGYAEPFRADARPVWLIGLSFDSKTRQLVDCIAEKMNFSTEAMAYK